MNNVERIENEIWVYLTSDLPAEISGESGKIGDISVRYYDYELEQKDIYLGTFYIPVKELHTVDKCLILFCLQKDKETVFDIIKKYQEDLFSQDCVDEIHGRIAGDLQQIFGVTMDSTFVNHDVLYAITEKGELNLSAKQDTAVKIAKFDEKTEYDVICTKIDREKPGIFYGTLIDDKIVSLAELEYGSDEGIAHVGYICTHKDYRNKGYALSNVAALAEDALNAGKLVIYNTGSDNIASQKTALGAGFSEIGKLKLYWFKKE